MTLKIDSLGRIVLPKQMRERLGFTPNSEIEVVYQPDGVLLRPESDSSEFTYENGVLIHHGKPIKNADWNVLDAMREERIKSILP